MAQAPTQRDPRATAALLAKMAEAKAKADRALETAEGPAAWNRPMVTDPVTIPVQYQPMKVPGLTFKLRAGGEGQQAPAPRGQPGPATRVAEQAGAVGQKLQEFNPRDVQRKMNQRELFIQEAMRRALYIPGVTGGVGNQPMPVISAGPKPPWLVPASRGVQALAPEGAPVAGIDTRTFDQYPEDIQKILWRRAMEGHPQVGQ